MTLPRKQGLYDPVNEHENCGIGLIVDMKGRKSHDIVQGACMHVNLDHAAADAVATRSRAMAQEYLSKCPTSSLPRSSRKIFFDLPP